MIRRIRQRDENHLRRQAYQDTETTVHKERKQGNLYSESIRMPDKAKHQK